MAVALQRVAVLLLALPPRAELQAQAAALILAVALGLVAWARQ
jgi:hypothetical protein